ncbi:MAG: general secretion pathway protein J [Myxococcota bacterium]|jgi:general secretion pathway protein J
MTRPNQSAGFTLMEVLVAVGVMSLMSALIFGVISSMFAISDDTDDIVDTNHAARVTLERISRDLSQAFLSLNFGELETRKTLFVGERDRLIFTYVGNIPVQAGAVETDQGVVEYKLEGNSDGMSGQNLVRRFKAVIDEDPESDGQDGILANGVKELEFEYWDEFRQEWDSDWRADDCLSATEPGFRLPSRVRIKLVLFDRRDQTYEFETQTSIYMTQPLLFGKPVTQKQKECRAARDLLRTQREANLL